MDVKEQAKQIMNDFFAALEKADVQTDSFGVMRETQTRDPVVSSGGTEFKDKILANAPSKNQDYIVAEKKQW